MAPPDSVEGAYPSIALSQRRSKPIVGSTEGETGSCPWVGRACDRLHLLLGAFGHGFGHGTRWNRCNKRDGTRQLGRLNVDDLQL